MTKQVTDQGDTGQTIDGPTNQDQRVHPLPKSCQQQDTGNVVDLEQKRWEDDIAEEMNLGMLLQCYFDPGIVNEIICARRSSVEPDLSFAHKQLLGIALKQFEKEYRS